MILIRMAYESDLPEIVSIYNESIPGRQATADTELVSVVSRYQWFQQHKDERPLWLAESNREIIGWISLQDFYGRPAYHHTAEFSLYVKSTHHRQGIAKNLLSHVIKECPKLDITTLLGFIFSHNQPSIALVKQFGFVQWGYLPKIAILDGIDKDLSIFGLKL